MRSVQRLRGGRADAWRLLQQRGGLMGYVALREMQVGDELRKPGARVPEAASWPNVAAYLQVRELALVPDEQEADIAQAFAEGRMPSLPFAPQTLLHHLAAVAVLSPQAPGPPLVASPDESPAVAAEP